MVRVYLNEDAVRELTAPAKGNKTYFFRGAVIEGKEVPRGFGVQVTAGGVKSWCLVYRDGDGRQRRETIGRWPLWTCVKASRVARDLRQALDRGETIGKAKTDAERGEKGALVSDVLDDFMKRHGDKLRTAKEYQRIFDKHVKPAIGTRGLYEPGLKLAIVKMLDDIEDHGLKGKGTPVQADKVLARLRTALNWQATRDERFISPIVRGMARTKPSERIRRRTLDDDELMTLWAALERPTEGGKGTRRLAGERLPECFPAFVRCLLLTTMRRANVATMHESELSIEQGGKHKGQWLWSIPPSKNKTRLPHVVPLSEQAKAELEAIGAKPGGKRYVFSTDGGITPFSGYSKAKTALDMRMAMARWEEKKPEVPSWVYHDLRRTARTMLSRLKVDHFIAERCIGHVIGGVAGVYDQWAYLEEKREAMAKLGELVTGVVAEW